MLLTFPFSFFLRYGGRGSVRPCSTPCDRVDGWRRPPHAADEVRCSKIQFLDNQSSDLHTETLTTSYSLLFTSLLPRRVDMPQVNLALSLHAPTQEARCKIVPTARQWHIDELIAVRFCFYFQYFQLVFVEHVCVWVILPAPVPSFPFPFILSSTHPTHS